jgi:hemolysin D
MTWLHSLASPHPPAIEGQLQGTSMIRVLLVDDQKSIRETLKSILESAADFDIVGMAANGFEAIELVQQLKPDVVLMDMEMPDIDGAIATKIIAQSELGERVKVLAISSYDSSECVTKSIQAGAKGYLIKGTSAEGIREAVRSVHQGYTQIASGLFEQIVPQAAALVPIDHPVLIETNVSGLALTGFQFKKKTPPEALPILENIDASQMLIDVVPITVKYRLRHRWRLPVVLIIAAGLGGAYWLRQRLTRPLPAISSQSQPLITIPFMGKIEPAQVAQVNSTASGFIEDIKVKVGQQVQMGESLLVIRNADDEISTQEESPLRNSVFQQQELQQQQQFIIQQQQFSQQRIASLQRQVSEDQQNIALLRSKIAKSPSENRNQWSPNSSALVQQQQLMAQKAQAAYRQQNSEYQRKKKLFESQQNLARGATSERIEQLMADSESARIEMEYTRSNYENAKLALQDSKQMPAAALPILTPGFNVQQQLEQEESLRQSQQQLRQEQLSYKQLSVNLQSLQQQSDAVTVPQVSTIATVPPVLVDVVASKSGYVVQLLVQDGDQISTGKRLMAIASNQHLKVAIQVGDLLPSDLKVGKDSIVQVQNGQDLQEFNGKIVSITPPSVNQQQKVEVEFGTTQDFLVGQQATVYFPRR